MGPISNNEQPDPTDVASVVQVGLAQENLLGLSEMLKTLAQSTDAYGCILWQIGHDSNLATDPPTGFLFVLAQWFEDGLGSTMYNMPLASSATGFALRNQRTINIQDVWHDARVYHKDPFLHQAGVRTMCSIPIRFPDGSEGAVNLYRRASQRFDSGELSRAERLSRLVPALYQAIQDKVSLRLIRTVDEVLHDAELGTRDELSARQAVGQVFQTICRVISDAFRAIETTIFLEDRLDAPGMLEVIATTWESDFGKRLYEQNTSQGITGWVVKNAKPVRIFDLSHFDRDKETIRIAYNDLTWKDSLTIESAARNSLNIDAHDRLPPLSLMAAPIVIGDNVLGLIRCAVARTEPRYFGDRELSLLERISARIGNYWHNWLRQREVLQENRSWHALVESISELNSFVHKELNQQEPNEHKIFAEALRVTSTVLKGAEITDIRLLDKKTGDLYFAETHGNLWNEGNKHEIAERKSRRFPVADEEARSAGAQVFKTGELYVIPDTLRDPYYSETFSSTGMIIAPIKIKGEVFGVLDIRRTGKSDFPRHAGIVAELLGQQLGLYRYLASTIGNLKKAEADLRENISALEQFQTNQSQTFEDLKHQLYGPITQAHARIQTLLRSEFRKLQLALNDAVVAESFEASLFAIRGLCAKAKRVALSTGLFAQLALGKGISINPKPLHSDTVVKMIIETSLDNRFMIDRNRQVGFHVDRESFEVLRSLKFDIDQELLEQAIINLLDNAVKYSFRNTTIYVHAAETRAGRFRITVSNTGLAIASRDVHLCVQRGWRSPEAKRAIGEGSGIGLWIVDNIMKAHGGELVISPTTSQGLTEISLIFAENKEG